MNMDNYYIARYELNGQKRATMFDKSRFTEKQASEWLQGQGVQNFIFFFEPYEPIVLSDDEILFTGEVGFDITLARILPYIKDKKKLVFDSFGGSLFEAYRILDAINHLDQEVEIGVIGICASAATLFPLATENSWTTANARFLLHNAFVFEAGDAAFMEKKAKALRDEENTLVKLYSK